MVRRIALAAAVLHSLSTVWKQRHLSIALKIQIYRALVLPVLLYASETWTMLECDARRVQSFHMQCRRRMLNIQWYDLISNDEILARTSLPSVLDIIRTRRLCLFGHVARLPHDTSAYSALSL